MRELITYLIIAVVGFYLFPLFCSAETVSTYFPTMLNPVIFFICSYSYGTIRPNGWWFPLLITVLFIPVLFVYYHPSEWYFLIGYAGVSFIGSAIGWLIGKKKLEEETRQRKENLKNK